MKKGFTIIEVIVSTALICILLCSEIILGARYLKAFNESIVESRDTFYVNQAFDFIEMMVDASECTAVNNNMIELVRRDGKGSDWIRRDSSGNLIISYYQCYYGTVNNVMKKNGSFEAVKNGGAIFILITTQKGKAYRRCILPKAEKVKRDLFWCIL
ncbi:MAG: type II secretion system protein [Solirubrobacterales bacterium]